MKSIRMYLIISFIFIFCLPLEDANILAEEPSAFCFQFTWLGPMYDEKKNQSVNCSEVTKTTPCSEPFIFTNDSSSPNTAELWEDPNKDEYICHLSPGYTCIKHTYFYNSVAINISYFCGKMIEDKTMAITSSCFTQKVDGHTIESCSCLSDRGMRPCNSAKITRSSFILLLILLLIKKIV